SVLILLLCLGGSLPGPARAQDLSVSPAVAPSPSPAAAPPLVPAAGDAPAPGAGDPGAVAADPDAAEADRLLGFAESLLAERDYYRAIGELKRFLHRYPTEPRRHRARLGIARAYDAGGKLDLAAAAYLELAAAAGTGPEAATAALAAADCYYRAFQYAQAEAAYRSLIERFPDGEHADLAHYRIAWTLIGRDQLPAASQHLAHVPAGSRFQDASGRLRQRLDAHADLPRRSPVAAGLFSAVLPGSGHVYAGRTADGLLAFFVVGVFGAATWETAASEDYVAAGLLGTFALGFYLGNVFGAVNGAQRFNADTHQAWVGTLVRELQSPPLPPRPAAPPAAWAPPPRPSLLALQLPLARW
ncbi:MAG: tetratricopeptide repeat protein, partial [Myxococcota bacterium]|nr:tetratricopeptide repeat protein [Myxococcota bacterium]